MTQDIIPFGSSRVVVNKRGPDWNGNFDEEARQFMCYIRRRAQAAFGEENPLVQPRVLFNVRFNSGFGIQDLPMEPCTDKLFLFGQIRIQG